MSATAADTLGLLERRLARLEFHLGDDRRQSAGKQSNGSQAPTESVSTQLGRLENRLNELCGRNGPALELLKLYGRDRELASFFDKQNENTSAQSGSGHQSVVLASGALIPQTVSDLNALQTQRIPETKPLTTLVSLGPRLEKALAVQQAQVLEERELRDRSAHLLARWYERSVLRSGEQWADWEDRLAKMELKLRREEHARRREEAGF